MALCLWQRVRAVISFIVSRSGCSSFRTAKQAMVQMIAEQAMVQMIAVRVTTARKLMHENPEGRSNRQERGPHRS